MQTDRSRHKPVYRKKQAGTEAEVDAQAGRQIDRNRQSYT